MNNNTTTDFDDDYNYSQKISSALKNIKERCDAVKITYVDSSDPETNEVDFKFSLPCGRMNREVAIYDIDDLESLEEVNFEEYNFVGNYAAIVSYKHGTLEALISTPNTMFGSRVKFRRILLNENPHSSSQTRSSERIIKIPDEHNPIAISLKRSSSAAKVLCQVGDPADLSILIKNISIGNQEKALEILRDISNTLFFSLDAQWGLHMSLIRQGARKKREPLKGDFVDLQFSSRKYDKAPMDLYWYARSASNMPLLQFLAYYQVVEYYYSTFFNFDISRRVRAIMKNPNFRIDSDTEIAKIISTVKLKGGGGGTEREQLKATLRECIDEEAFSKFVESSKERAEFFLVKNKGITSCTINLKNRNTDLHVQLAERIYDIRCKIVHTKGDENDGDVELLLPYSAEAEKLDEDIHLMRFVAQQVIIYTSK